jgi:TPR repeat protein
MEAGRYDQAFCLWRPLADRGYAEAQYTIGWMYANGQGVAPNEKIAASWWRRAAEGNYADAEFAMAEAYLSGIGVPKDRARAVPYLWRASVGGVEDAGIILRDLAGRDLEPAFTLVQDLLAAEGWRALGGRLRVAVDEARVWLTRGSHRTLVAKLKRGALVVELTRNGGWVRVGIPGSRVPGWLPAAQLRKVEGSSTYAGGKGKP